MKFVMLQGKKSTQTQLFNSGTAFPEVVGALINEGFQQKTELPCVQNCMRTSVLNNSWTKRTPKVPSNPIIL